MKLEGSTTVYIIQKKESEKYLKLIKRKKKIDLEWINWVQTK